MKYAVIAFLLLSPFFSFTQKVNQVDMPNSKIYLKDNKEALSFLYNELIELYQKDVRLNLTFEKSSTSSHHYSFELIYKQIPILNSMIKVNTNKDGKIMSIKKEYGDLNKLFLLNIENEIENWNNKDIDALLNRTLSYASSVKKTQYKISLENNIPEVVLEVSSWSSSLDRTDYFSIDESIKLSYNHERNFNQDTIVKVTIFNPDPLTTQGVPYGGIYIDNTDAHQSWMVPNYDTVEVLATYDNLNNTFYLENAWAILEDTQAPLIDPVTSTTPTFYYYRNQSGFEDCNAFYHITHFHDYISSLGYDTLMNKQLRVDSHAMLGDDNSAFFRNGGNPYIRFGTGGVDDAEDADVIVHEYCHGVSWSANNNANFTIERSGLDEGLADYFATSYSRSISPFSWEKVFTWDAHNEFWIGRIANTTATYPSSGNLYAIGEIWNRAMSDIWTDLGAVVTDKLMLETLLFLTDQTTLPEAAKYVLQSDTILFNGIHASTICTHFQNRNILDANCEPVGIKDVIKFKDVLVKNLLGFANNESDLVLDFQEIFSGNISIYTLSGQCVFNENVKQLTTYNLQPKHFNKGMYILKLQKNEGIKTFKIIKHQ